MLEWIVDDFDNSLKFAASFYLNHYPKELFNGGVVCVNGVEIKLNCLMVEASFVLMWLEKKWMLHDNRALKSVLSKPMIYTFVSYLFPSRLYIKSIIHAEQYAKL